MTHIPSKQTPKEYALNPNPQRIVDDLLPHRVPAHESASAFAPANIALCKYWGKRNEPLKLPLTGSLSVSLGDLGTRMTLRVSDQDRLHINQIEQPPESKAFSRLFSFIDLFRKPGTCLAIESINTIPMSAGLASSASAFAATVHTLNALYDWKLNDSQRSILSRIGSGSASRSVYHGFVEWFPGEQDNGMDSYAESLNVRWPEIRVGILTLSNAEKPIGSSEGMKRTLETSVLYRSWPDQVKQDLPVIREAIYQKDFPLLGKTAEQNAMSMHATMIAAWPPILYWRPESLETLHKVHRLREKGVDVFATMDAGPNVKILFTEESTAVVKEAFPDVRIVAPFSDSESYCNRSGIPF